MKKTKNARIVLQLVCGMLTLFAFTNCATRIQLDVQRTPELNTTGIHRIAIMPFEPVIGSGIHQNAARHATTVATSRIQATNHFTLVSPSLVGDARRRGQNIENYVDALFVGRIVRVSYTMNTAERERRVEGQTETFIVTIREVEVELSYSFERARDGTIIGPIVRRSRASDTQENPAHLASVDTLANRAIDNQLRNLHQDVAPHTVRVTRTLERERDSALRSQMDAARAQVRNGNYVAARHAYMAIWESHQSVAAAVNAAILYEAVGETQRAAIFMQQVHAETGSPLAMTTLNRLNRELGEQASVAQMVSGQSPAERTTNHAINEIRRVIPADARLWIHNNATANHHLVNNVIDDMISTFLREGIPIVERQMIDMILMEQDLHMEGHVTDSDFLSIGQLAGANTIVITNIIGSGAGRRLQLRVLDITTGSVIMQSGTGAEWHL